MLVGWLPLVLLPTLAICFRDSLAPWLLMWLLAFLIFAGLKVITWWKARNSVPHSSGRSIAYLAAWPGMDAETFLDSRKRAPAPHFREWLWALSKTFFGAALLWQVVRRVPEPYPLIRGWVVLAGARHRCGADYVKANIVEEPERVLGQTLESRFPPTRV